MHRSPRIIAAHGATAVVLSRGVEGPSEVDRATLDLLAGRGQAPIGGLFRSTR
jgi:hypothetical protein